MPFNIDLHSHTFFSGDGVSSPEENIAAGPANIWRYAALLPDRRPAR